MNVQNLPDLPQAREDTTGTIIKLAILAVGGQGGGVLTNWVTDLARRGGYLAQATSVAGVAQRTGSTIYYIEMARDEGRAPVFALTPSPGDVDIMIAAELMEAGRAIMRGFVTPDRTTLIASTHRILATTEKVVPGDGRVEADPVLQEARQSAHRAICLDLEAAAAGAGSVISASLFGALAGSGALPFDRALFEETIRASGRGVEASLRAFAAGFDGAEGSRDAGGRRQEEAPLPATGAPEPASVTDAGAAPDGPDVVLAEWRDLSRRLDRLPDPLRPIARSGLTKVVDYQDVRYGAEYLDRLDLALKADSEDRGWHFSREAAKYLANAMTYDDVIRVADLKTRPSRETRLRREQDVGVDDIVLVTEYFHPRAEEVCGIMPARLGRWVEARPRVFGWLGRRLDKGRHLRTDALSGFVPLWLVAGLKRWRRSLRRHEMEQAHLNAWFDLAVAEAARDYAVGVEVLRCRRLIKGYSDTHSRGLSKFARVLGGLDMLRGRPDAADWLRRLREAALRDEKGEELDGALKTVATL